MFNLYNWSLYGKSPYDYLKQQKSGNDKEIIYETVQKELTNEELIELLQKQIPKNEQEAYMKNMNSKQLEVAINEINKLREENLRSKTEGLIEGRTFGQYEGAYKTLYPHLAREQHPREHDDTFLGKVDKSLFELDTIKNIEIINAKNYKELETDIITKAVEGHDSIDKKFFKSDTYKKYDKDIKKLELQIETQLLQNTKINNEIVEVLTNINNLKDEELNIINNKNKSETYLKIIDEESKLNVELKNIKNKLPTEEEFKKTQKLFKEEEKKNMSILNKKSSLPKKKVQKKPPIDVQMVIKEKSELARKMDVITGNSEKIKEIEKQLKDLEKKKNNLTKVIKDNIIVEEKKYKLLEKDSKKSTSKIEEIKKEVDKINKSKLSYGNEINKKLGKKLKEDKHGNPKDILTSLIDGVKIGDKGRLFVGPAVHYIKDVNLTPEMARNVLDEKIEAYKKSFKEY